MTMSEQHFTAQKHFRITLCEIPTYHEQPFVIPVILHKQSRTGALYSNFRGVHYANDYISVMHSSP